MKRHFLPILSILLLLGFSINQKPQWKGKIEEENGVKVIKNPKEPLFGEIIFDLEENFSIGNELDENYLFYKVRDIGVDTKDRIYVLDAGNRRVQVFNKLGQYVMTIGQRGQGPGEFENPVDLFIDTEDKLYVLDNRRVTVFDAKGSYISTIRTEIQISEFSVTSHGTIIARLNPSLERKKSIVRINQNGAVINKYGEYPDVKPAVRKGQRRGSYTIFTAFHDYTAHPRFCLIDEVRFIYGSPLEYKLNISEIPGNLIMIIKKDEFSESIGRVEKDKIIAELEESISRSGRKWPKGALEEASKFPPHRPFYRDILVDEVKRIYVLKVMSVLNEDQDIEADIYSESGYYIYKTSLPFYPSIIRSGNLYGIVSSEETGEEIIKKYTIKNWDQIKEGI